MLSRHGRWFLPTMAAMLALAIGYAAYMDHSGVQSGTIGNVAPPYPVR